MINKNLLDELNRLGFGADVDALESHVESLQNAAGMGKPLVTDTVYDQHYRLLRELKPDSPILNRNWEVDDNELDEYDGVLSKYGMRSIRTIQTMDDLYKFKVALGDQVVTLTATTKLNGHAIRAVYYHGQLKSGSTRGRYKKGRDITRHLKAVLPNYVEAWKDMRIVEVRGELLVSLENFNLLRHILKTPLSAVTSLVRDSVTDDELKYLSCVTYKVIPDGDDNIKFDTLWDELDHLNECGFEVPPRVQIEDVTAYNLDQAVEDLLRYFEEQVDNGFIMYDTDGVVAAVDDLNTFYSMGMDGNAYLGNVALKMGKHWESNIYSGTILSVVFEQGKTYLTPKAIIEPVITVTGAEVTNVPLYNIGVMEKLGLTPGNEVHFRFGGETGVTTVAPDGTPVSALD